MKGDSGWDESQNRHHPCQSGSTLLGVHAAVRSAASEHQPAGPSDLRCFAWLGSNSLDLGGKPVDEDVSRSASTMISKNPTTGSSVPGMDFRAAGAGLKDHRATSGLFAIGKGAARDAEGEAIRLNVETQGSDSFRPEELGDSGDWRSVGFRRGGFSGSR